jgi:hypothetical protein
MSGFFNYSSLVSCVETISRLDDEQYATLLEATSSADAYDHSPTRCNELAKKLNGDFDASKIFRLLVSLEFLYDRLREWESQERDGDKSLREFLEITDLLEKLEPEKNSYDKLLHLTAKNTTLERRKKLRRLRTGLLDTATGFASFVDIRPRFADDRSSLEELVPVVILRVTIDSDGEEPARSPVFQLSLAGVQKLRHALDDVENKLKALKNDRVLSERLNLETDEETDKK